MLIEIKKPITRKKLDAALEKLATKKSKTKGFNAKRWCGAIKWPEEGVALQQKWRNEK